MGRIQIIKIGITNLETDALVNAANENLKAGAGVCGAIFNSAGFRELQDACDKIGKCATGSAVITPGFKLKSKFIIHAVGPRWTDGKHKESLYDDNADIYEYEDHEDFDDIDEEDTLEYYVIKQETIAAKAEAEDFLGSSFLEPDEEWTVSEEDRLVHIYIEKKPEEEFNNTQFYDRIRAAIQPENKGGLPFPRRECVSDKLLLSNGIVFDRRSARENALAGGV